MHSKFHITGRYVTVLSLLLGYLPVQNWWFLASEGSVIKAIVEDFMQTYQVKFHIKYLSKFLCIWGMWIVYFSIHGMHVVESLFYSMAQVLGSC